MGKLFSAGSLNLITTWNKGEYMSNEEEYYIVKDIMMHLIGWTIAIGILTVITESVVGSYAIMSGIYIWLLLPPLLVSKYKLKKYGEKITNSVMLKISVYYMLILCFFSFLYVLSVIIDLQIKRPSKYFDLSDTLLTLFFVFLIFFIGGTFMVYNFLATHKTEK